MAAAEWTGSVLFSLTNPSLLRGLSLLFSSPIPPLQSPCFPSSIPSLTSPHTLCRFPSLTVHPLWCVQNCVIGVMLKELNLASEVGGGGAEVAEPT